MTKSKYGRVSIVMPAYNCASVISAAVQSVLCQTYPDWELIIVEDCSSDNTRDVLEQIAALDDPRVKILYNSYNFGPARSRNRAIREATGRWIAFLDSDDLWLTQKLERQLRFMIDHEVAFSYTDYEHINHRGERMYKHVSGPNVISRNLFRKYCWVGCLTIMYDASVVGLIQAPLLKNREDYALWLKIVQKTPCYRLPETLALYRAGQTGSQSSGGVVRLVKHHYQMFRISEEETPVKALFLTAQNLVFGFFKKTFYVRAYR